jgi:hypothetical protein
MAFSSILQGRQGRHDQVPTTFSTKVGLVSISIRNCRFAFRCTRKWDKLKVTADEGVRYCSDCERTVHWCSTDRELAQAVAFNHCVAIDVDGVMLGDVELGVPLPPR